MDSQWHCSNNFGYNAVDQRLWPDWIAFVFIWHGVCLIGGMPILCLMKIRELQFNPLIFHRNNFECLEFRCLDLDFFACGLVYKELRMIRMMVDVSGRVFIGFCF